MGTHVEMRVIPNCDFCNDEYKVDVGLIQKAKYDGKTRYGYWAYMCEHHWKVHGCQRLGTGFGQILIRKGDS